MSATVKSRWPTARALLLLLLLVPRASGATGGAAAGGQRSAVHTTRGVVKSMDSNAIVVARPKGRGDITFRLGAVLHQNGTIVIGAAVSVRYEDRGDEHVALAVTVQRP